MTKDIEEMIKDALLPVASSNPKLTRMQVDALQDVIDHIDELNSVSKGGRRKRCR